MLRIILCSGIKRSASTWSYNVCRQLGARIAKATGAQFFAEYANDTDAMLLALEKKYTDRQTAGGDPSIVAVIKAHESGPRTRRLAKAGQLHNVYTIRDPRDCLASMETFWPRENGETLDDRIREFQHWLIDGESFVQDGASMIIRFEAMRADPRAEIARIAAYLKVRCEDKTLADINDATSEETSKKLIDQIVKEKSGPDRVFHRPTQLHENHLDGGRIGRWRDDFSDEEQRKIETAFHPWLIGFGYTTGEGG